MKKPHFFRSAMALMLLSIAAIQCAFAAPTRTVPLQVSAERSTTMSIWEPTEVRGVVLFSTGHGAWPERYDALMQAWRDAGFVVLSPLHVDSMKYPQREKFSLQQAFIERLSDMKAASAYAAEQWPGLPVAAAGHSYGTLVSLVLGGAMSEVMPLRDPSIAAVIGYSSPGKIPGLITPRSYATVAVPMLIITGDHDLVPGFVSDAKDHLYPVETAPAGDHSAVVLAGGTHELLGGKPEAVFTRARDIGTAFLKAQLLKDAEGARLLLAEDSATEHWLRR